MSERSDSNLKSQACSQSKMVQINIRVKSLIIFHSCRIVGQNPDRSLKSFPPCYSQSPLQHCLVISISSYPCNLLHISSNSRNLLRISTVKLHKNVKGKVWKPDRKSYPLPYVLRNPYRNLKSENSRLCIEASRNCKFMNSVSVQYSGGGINLFRIDSNRSVCDATKHLIH
jgi:hypothetical protein